MVNNEGIELMLFQLKEGLLSDEEARKATLFLQQHPEWQEVADLYDPMLKAPSYPAAGFPNKESLHKTLTKTARRKTSPASPSPDANRPSTSNANPLTPTCSG